MHSINSMMFMVNPIDHNVNPNLRISHAAINSVLVSLRFILGVMPEPQNWSSGILR